MKRSMACVTSAPCLHEPSAALPALLQLNPSQLFTLGVILAAFYAQNDAEVHDD